MENKRQLIRLWPDAGQILGMKRQTTYNSARKGDIPTVNIGGMLFVSIKQLDRLINGDLADL